MVAASAGCPVESDGRGAAGSDAERGLGKADGVWGSCAGKKYDDACGGPADEGNCWCDDLCADYGDCCADKGDVCGGDEPVDPEPKLCMGDDDCGDGMHCDHSECLSSCSGGEICPAVCFGACVEGEPEPTCELPGDDRVGHDRAELRFLPTRDRRPLRGLSLRLRV